MDRIDRPDRLVFDLDPSDGAFAKVQDAAARVRALLEELDIVPFVTTTGSRGLHVVIARHAVSVEICAIRLAKLVDIEKAQGRPVFIVHCSMKR